MKHYYLAIIFISRSLLRYSDSRCHRNEIGLKNDILKANIFSESEDGLISNVSDLKFFQPSLNLAAWINYNTYNSIAEPFNEYEGDVYFYPEHFLLPEGINSIYVGDRTSFVHLKISLDYGSNDSLEDYLQILVSAGIDLKNSLCFRTDCTF